MVVFLALDIVQIGLPGKQVMELMTQEMEVFWESRNVATSQLMTLGFVNSSFLALDIVEIGLPPKTGNGIV